MKSLAALFYPVAVCLLLAGCWNEPPSRSLLHATTLSEPRPIHAFQLIDQEGRSFTQQDLRGRWHILFAGFTYCPDICPTTLAMLASAQKRANVSNERVNVVFVSVDPDRDTPSALAEYLRQFDVEWIGLTGAKSEINRLLESLELAYVRVPTGNGEYTMDHSTVLVLIDPSGNMHGYFKAPLDVEALGDDLSRLPRAGR